MIAGFRSGPVLAAAMSACRRHWAYAALFSALINLLMIAPMLYMLQVYDRVIPTQGTTTLLLLTIALAIALGSMAALEAVRSSLLVRAGVALEIELAGRIMRSSFAAGRSDTRLSRPALREFDVLRQALTGPAMHGLFDAPWVPFYIFVAFVIHPWIGVMALVGTMLILLLAWRSETATRDPVQRVTAASGRSHAALERSLQQADVARSLGLGEALVRGHLASRDEMVTLQADAGLTTARLTAQSKLVRMMIQSLALGLGALLAINAAISPGAVFASMFIVGRALAPIDQLIGSWRTIAQARGSIQLLDDLLRQTPPVPRQTRLPSPAGHLGVEGLTVLRPGQRPILHGVGFEVLPGQVVAIVGPSGAGKSTLVRALASAQQADAGSIRFDRCEQRDWDPEQLAEHIGFMPQETTLFEGTIKDNLTRFRSRLGGAVEALDEEAVDAARLAGAHQMIQQLPGGYDHHLPVGGGGLSSGQAQRIALARALFRRPRFVFLDEPNSSLDAEGDSQLTATLERLKQAGTTILVVAHRLSLLPVVDKLLVLRDGQLVMFGDRDEVLDRLRAPQVSSPSQLALQE